MGEDFICDDEDYSKIKSQCEQIHYKMTVKAGDELYVDSKLSDGSLKKEVFP